MLNHKGQSATEMAIFGTLIIAAFSFIIMFSERINRQQSYIMQGFRESLKEARSLKGPVSYTKYADRRMPNVSTPMALGNQETFSTNSNVMWGNQFGISSSNTLGLAATELSKSYTYIKLNDAPLIEVPDIATPAAGTIATEVTTTTQQTHTEYEPEQFPGLVYKLTEPNATFLLFSNGKLVCTGTKNKQQLEDRSRNEASLEEEIRNISDSRKNLEQIDTEYVTVARAIRTRKNRESPS